MALELVTRLKSRQPLLFAAAIFVLAFFLTDNAFVSSASRSVTVFLLQLLGFSVEDTGEGIVIGSLLLPWTDDCSGVNALLLLWSLCLWVHRNLPLSSALLGRLAVCVPLAFAANTARILSIALYRHVNYPTWESPEVHYFIGIVWLLPCLSLLVPDFRERSLSFWANLLYGAVVLALVAPMLLNPGGFVSMLCALLIMSRNGVQEMSRGRWFLTGLWVPAAFFIAETAMESFWLPWLLVSPMFLSKTWLKRWEFPMLLAGTISFLTMVTAAAWFLVLIVVVHVLIQLREQQEAEIDIRNPGVNLLASALILLPIVVPSLFSNEAEVIEPPGGLLSRQVTNNAYQFKVVGQTQELSSFWFGPFSDGRHHSLLACLTFRGVKLDKVDNADFVFEGEGKWMTEFFIHEGKLLENYFEYLLSSLKPSSSPGVHLIFEAPSRALGPENFRAEAARAARAANRLLNRHHNWRSIEQ